MGVGGLAGLTDAERDVEKLARPEVHDTSNASPFSRSDAGVIEKQITAACGWTDFCLVGGARCSWVARGGALKAF